MITKELVCRNFDYKDGDLYFKQSRTNQINKGDKAGGVNSTGYRIVRLNGGRYLQHRLVFLMHHGYLPKYVDHIDNNPLNNRIENLRECTFSENRCNTPRAKNNTSGEKGIAWDKGKNAWVARISKSGKRFYLGAFNNFDEAKKVIRLKRKELHSDFANNM